MTCDGINLIKGPTGHVAFRIHSFQSDSDMCRTIALTKAEVIAILAKLTGTPAPADADLRELVTHVRGRSFADAVKLFQEKAGNPTATGESEYAAWRYVDDDRECRILLLSTTLDRYGPGTGYVESIQGLPCD